MKTKKKINRSVLSLPVAGVLCMLTMTCTSCRNEDPVDINGPGKQVTITMSVPGDNPADGPVTYAMPADEAKVETVDVLCFQTDPAGTTDVDKGTFLYRASVGHTAGATSFQVILSELDVSPAVNQTLVVLANCRTEVETLMGTITAGATKASVISSLVLSQSTKFDASTMTGIPMWGEITNQPVTSGYSPGGLNVTLTRMLAKIDIKNEETDFDLLEAYLYNPRQKGSIIPDNWTGTDVNTPTSVTGAQMTQKAWFGPFTTLTETIADQIFTFEADNASKAAADQLDATCLVIGGKYNGSTTNTYYRVDLKNYTTDAFYDVKRNYKYNVTIRAITFEGEPTPDKAFEGKAVIEATVQPWNDRNSSVVAGPSHLRVNSALFDYTYAAASKTFEIFTDYHGGWTVTKIVDGAGNPITWLTIDAASGAAGQTNTAINATDNPGAARTGKIHITANNMTHVITVKQAMLANSYIVAPNTAGFEIPVLRCNGSDLGEQLAAGESFTAEVVWESDPDAISTVTTQGNGPSGFIEVSTGAADGNAVVCIKKSGVILWSWHIWVTNYDPESTSYVSNGFTMMERNLGALNNTPGDIKSFGLLYQWGRKDPFPGSESTTSTAMPTYATVVKTSAPSGPYPDILGVAVKNPRTWFAATGASGGHWFAYTNGPHNNALWGPVKTVYDPCPEGWAVPTNGGDPQSPLYPLSPIPFTLGFALGNSHLNLGYYPAGGCYHNLKWRPAVRGKLGELVYRSRGIQWKGRAEPQ